jgi:putative inorganic carbon (HCO3(-)) transporter
MDGKPPPDRLAGTFCAVTDLADRAGSVAAGLFLAGVVLLPIMQVRVGVGSTDLIPADVAFVLAGAAAIVALIGRRIPIRRTLFTGALVAYVGALLLALVTGGVTRTTLSGAATGAYVAGLAALAHHLAPARVSPARFLKAFVAGAAIAAGTALVGLVLFYAGFDRPSDNRFIGVYGNVPHGRYPRVIGSFLSPNLLCNFLACGLVAVLTAQHVGLISRRLTAALAGGIVVAVGFTLSPGIGGVLLAAGVWLWAFPAVRSERARRGALVAGAVGATAFFVLTVFMLKLDDGLQQSLRVRAWQSSGQRFLHSPLVGVGLDENLGHVRPDHSSALITDAHNMWLSVAGQMGLVGVVAIGSVIAAPFLDVERRRRIWRQPIARGLAIALLGALAYQGLSMSVEDARHLWIVLGVLASLAYVEREEIVVS